MIISRVFQKYNIQTLSIQINLLKIPRCNKIIQFLPKNSKTRTQQKQHRRRSVALGTKKVGEVVGVGVANAVCTTKQLERVRCSLPNCFRANVLLWCDVTAPRHDDVPTHIPQCSKKNNKHVAEKNAIRTKGNTVDSSE